MALQTMKASKGDSKFELWPAGAHQAALVAIIDLGTQTHKYKDKTSESAEVLFVWELVDEKNSKGQPVVVHRGYSQFFTDRSHLRAMAEGWRGKPYAENEEFVFQSAIGKPCQVNIKHGKGKTSGKEFAEVTAVTALSKGMKPIKPAHEPFIWEIAPGAVLPDHDWIPYLMGVPIVEVIKKSKEWKELAMTEHDARTAKGTSEADEILPEEEPQDPF